MKYLVIKEDYRTLRLVDPFEIEIFSMLPNNKVYEITLVAKRDPQYHRKFRGFLNTLYDSIPDKLEYKYPTFEVFYKNILLATGFYRYKIIDGQKEIEYKSTAFKEMNEDEYRYLIRLTIEVIQKKYFDFDKDNLIKILEEYKYY